MRTILIPSLHALAAAVRSRAALQLEILALRQQLAVRHHSGPKRPNLRPVDRFFWACLSKLWPGWRSPLIIVKPDTVVAWSRKGFRLFWTWKSRRGRGGRPAVPKDVRDLIRKISQANPLYVKSQYMWSIGTKACQLGVTWVFASHNFWPQPGGFRSREHPRIGYRAVCSRILRLACQPLWLRVGVEDAEERKLM